LATNEQLLMNGFKFEKLIIWQRAMELGENINDLTESFAQKEIYNLSSQIRRAADSVALNISEGSIVQSSPEYKKFLGYSNRSLAEVVTCLHKAKNKKYIIDNEFDKHYEFCFNLMNMLISFRNKI
jgi:four helix bundle protein